MQLYVNPTPASTKEELVSLEGFSKDDLILDPIVHTQRNNIFEEFRDVLIEIYHSQNDVDRQASSLRRLLFEFDDIREQEKNKSTPYSDNWIRHRAYSLAIQDHLPNFFEVLINLNSDSVVKEELSYRFEHDPLFKRYPQIAQIRFKEWVGPDKELVKEIAGRHLEIMREKGIGVDEKTPKLSIAA